jgi:mono/diheme cytochrome c family protein
LPPNHITIRRNNNEKEKQNPCNPDHVGLIGFIDFQSLTLPLTSEPWEVPAKFKKMENPYTANDESLRIGKMQYSKHCASCHGKKDLGDGVKARSLETHPGDFTDDAYTSQTDGEHFYKSKFGRKMPKFENKISDEDLWHIVNYINTFK